MLKIFGPHLNVSLEDYLMSDWSFEELQEWDEKIVKIAKDHGLDWYDISYETID